MLQIQIDYLLWHLELQIRFDRLHNLEYFLILQLHIFYESWSSKL